MEYKDIYVLPSGSQSGIFFKHSVWPMIILWLRVSRMRGEMWIAMCVDSRVREGCELFMWLVSLPHCVVAIM